MEIQDLVTKARDLAPTEGSLTVIAGPYGLGKSWACGTMANYLDPEEILVIATLPRETDSYLYQKHDLDTIVVTDEAWEPSEGSLSATGYDKLIDIFRELRTDEKYSGIILDNMTEAGELAWHAALEPLGVADPNDLGRGGNRFAPYTSVREKMEQLTRSLGLLTGKTGLVARPKLIAVPMHVQPPKETTDDDKSADEKAKGAEYEGDYLPMIRGSFRRRFGTLVDNYVYASIESVPTGSGLKTEERFVLQVRSDRERHVKLAGPMPDEADLVKGKYLDVHRREDTWERLMEILSQEDES